MSEQVLLVDDELLVLKAYERNLGADFELALESSPEQALLRLEHEGPFAVILTDFNMPKMNGNEFLIKARKMAPDTVRIMLTGNADLEKSMEAVNEGNVFRFLTKPTQIPALKKCIDDGIRQYQLVTAEKDLLAKTLNGSIQVMMEILSIMNHTAFSLAQKRRKAAKLIAQRVEGADLWAIEIAALLADVGMVTLPDDTMTRFLSGGMLDDYEKTMIEKLPEMSSQLVQKIPRLQKVANIIQYQGKNYDGTGFPPDETKQLGIPVGSRILRVLNDYFRIVSKGTHPGEAIELLKLSEGKYDPRVIAALQASAMNMILPQANAKSLRKVGTQGLAIGQTLRSDVLAKNGTLILKANQLIGAAHLQRIANFSSSGGVQEPIVVEG